MKSTFADSNDVAALWKRVSAKFQAMTPEEKRQTYVDAGILTKKGNVCKRYRNVIVPVSAGRKAK